MSAGNADEWGTDNKIALTKAKEKVIKEEKETKGKERDLKEKVKVKDNEKKDLVTNVEKQDILRGIVGRKEWAMHGQ